MLTATARRPARATALTAFAARAATPTALPTPARAIRFFSLTALASRTTPPLTVAIAARALGLRLPAPTRPQLHLAPLELATLRLVLHRRHGQRLWWRRGQRRFGGGQSGPRDDENDGGEQRERPDDVAPADAPAQRREAIGIHVPPRHAGTVVRPLGEDLSSHRYHAPPLMGLPAPVYDLLLLLDPRAEDAQREKVVNDAERIIGGGGTIVENQPWGTRAMAYEVDHQKEAVYHLIQFEAPRETIESLDRALHIADGVVRYRIIKLPLDAPAPTPLGAAVPEPLAAERSDRSDRSDR